MNFNGVKYSYHTYRKTCLNQRTDNNSQPDNGKCYDDVDGSTIYEADLTQKVQWCYCKNKDFCNAGIMLSANIAVVILFYFFALNLS